MSGALTESVGIGDQFAWCYWPDGDAWFCTLDNDLVTEPIAIVQRLRSGEWRWEVTGDRHCPTFASHEPTRLHAVEAATRELLRPHRIH
jgi:hypothetical protein